MTSQHNKIIFLKKQLANIVNVKINRDSFAYISYTSCQVFKKILSSFS